MFTFNYLSEKELNKINSSLVKETSVKLENNIYTVFISFYDKTTKNVGYFSNKINAFDFRNCAAFVIKNNLY